MPTFAYVAIKFIRIILYGLDNKLQMLVPIYNIWILNYINNVQGHRHKWDWEA